MFLGSAYFPSGGCLFAGGFAYVRQSALGVQCQTISPEIKQLFWNQLLFPLEAVFSLGAFHMSARVHLEANAKQFSLESNNYSGISSIFLWGLPFCWGLSIIPPECTLRLMPKNHPGSARFPSGGFLFAGGFPPQYTLRRMCANGGRRCAWHVGRARRKQFLLKQFFHQSGVCPGRIK